MSVDSSLNCTASALPFSPAEAQERHTPEGQPVDQPQGRVERAVTTSVRRHDLWIPGACVVVAVSGGADSLCLVGALLALRAQGVACAPGEIVVAHLDHGLRGAEGREDAAFVEAIAREQRLRFVGATVDVAAIAEQERRSLEDAARNARYAFLRRVAVEVDADRICVGHTSD